MVTTRAGHAKKISGAELDDDDGGAALAGGTSPSRTSEGMPAPGAGGIDLGEGFRRRLGDEDQQSRLLRRMGWFGHCAWQGGLLLCLFLYHNSLTPRAVLQKCYLC